MSEGNPTDTEDMVPEAKLVELHLDSAGLSFHMQHPVVPLLASSLVDAFAAAGGKNYVSFEIHSDTLGWLELIMQRREGESPGTLAHRYREALEKIRDGAETASDIAREALSSVRS